jgi:transposase
MIGLPAGAQIWIACGVTDLRKGFDGLTAVVQTQLTEDPFLCVEFEYVAAEGEHAANRLISRRLARGRRHIEVTVPPED